MTTVNEKKAAGTRRPLERVLRIHELVRQGKFPNCSTIADRLEVNRKTIQRDINFMRDELDLPIEYHEHNHGYYYSKPVNEFPFLKVTPDEVVEIIMARNAVKGLGGGTLESSLRNGLKKIVATMSDSVTFHLTELDEAFASKSFGMTKRDVFLFQRLATAVLESREISFDYVKLKSSQPERRRVQPYQMAEIEKGWYLIGYDLDRKDLRTFAVQRIRGGLSLTSKNFIRPRTFRLEDHLAGSFGVWTGDGETHEVRIRFSGFAARYVEERQWHPSQKIVKNGDTVEISLTLNALEDVFRWVLSWGSQAEVLSPPAFRQMVASEQEKSARLYRES